MIKDTMKQDKLYHACAAALYVIEYLLTDNAKEPHKKRLTHAAEELRAALDYRTVNQRKGR